VRQHADGIRGKGRLTGGGHVYVVGYVIDVYQKYAGSVPTLRFATGHLTGIRAGDVVHAMLHTSLDLELEGTRHVQVSLRTLDGDFDVAGPIATAPERKKAAE